MQARSLLQTELNHIRQELAVMCAKVEEDLGKAHNILRSADEELIGELKRDFSIVIVTHSMNQAARVSDRTAFFLLGDLIEYGETKSVFTNPKDKRTEDYISGRFG